MVGSGHMTVRTMYVRAVWRVCAGGVHRLSARGPAWRAACRGAPAAPRPGAPSMSRGLHSGRRDGAYKSSCRPPVILLSAAAFSLFSKLEEDKDEELTLAEENIVYHLKKAKMANVAFLRGDYDRAEKLFKTTLVYMIDGGVKQDDNSFIEISLKMASIYAARNQNDLAVAGFQFCIMSLDEKIEKEKELSAAMLRAEERTNTRLLLGLCLDSYARYLLANSQLLHAQTMYERALQICREEQGELHPQTVTLLSDLATVLEAQGRFEEAYTYVKQALDAAQQTEHPNQHVILGNMAMILLHQEHLMDAERIFKEALTKAEEKKDSWSITYIQKGLSELTKRKKHKEQNV
ncbi:tetratricopeptide repeat protein 19, mitochondrial isoform X2 [Dendrobates tinctorius]|uniref:tetratricopeptide repeat protein 19, mitochondrial isoform X2 n=1 Tax=Dendrobates tinctorius TaxID=92724 RepID=UPI003CC959EA